MTPVIEVTGLTKRIGVQLQETQLQDKLRVREALEDEAEELCDRDAIFERGRIAALDTPAGLADSAGGEYRMRFRPMATIDERSLAGVRVFGLPVALVIGFGLIPGAVRDSWMGIDPRPEYLGIMAAWALVAATVAARFFRWEQA